MKHSQFLKWLKSQGVEVKEGSNHTKLYLNDKKSTIPRHGSKEIPTGLVRAIKKQLGLL